MPCARAVSMSSSGSSRPTAAATPRRSSRIWRSSRDARSSTAASRWRRWTSTRSCSRKPQVCVVDELAHTNVPGSRHAKRYEDVARDPRRGHSRHDGREHPASRDAQRRRRAGDRCSGARDGSRHVSRSRRRSHQRRRHGRGAAQPAARRQDLPPREGRAGAVELLPQGQSVDAAGARAARRRRRSRREGGQLSRARRSRAGADS